jgi:hypothetical protein
MGNANTEGPLAPVVVAVRRMMGDKEFTKLRGRAIAEHTRVIRAFCKFIGADTKQAQGLVRMAKKNGERLGLLA